MKSKSRVDTFSDINKLIRLKTAKEEWLKSQVNICTISIDSGGLQTNTIDMQYATCRTLARTKYAS